MHPFQYASNSSLNPLRAMFEQMVTPGDPNRFKTALQGLPLRSIFIGGNIGKIVTPGGPNRAQIGPGIV